MKSKDATQKELRRLTNATRIERKQTLIVPRLGIKPISDPA